jgi:hypothetical protein
VRPGKVFLIACSDAVVLASGYNQSHSGVENGQQYVAFCAATLIVIERAGRLHKNAFRSCSDGFDPVGSVKTPGINQMLNIPVDRTVVCSLWRGTQWISPLFTEGSGGTRIAPADSCF